MTDDIINAAKEAAYNFHKRLSELHDSEQLRTFVDDYFQSADRMEFWWNIAWFYETRELWGDVLGQSLKPLFSKEATREWNKKKKNFPDPKAQLGFILGSTR